jgi:hypothetical protein
VRTCSALTDIEFAENSSWQKCCLFSEIQFWFNVESLRLWGETQAERQKSGAVECCVVKPRWHRKAVEELKWLQLLKQSTACDMTALLYFLLPSVPTELTVLPMEPADVPAIPTVNSPVITTRQNYYACSCFFFIYTSVTWSLAGSWIPFLDIIKDI